MFIELNFTSNKKIQDVFRIANEIINQPSITSASTLNTYLTANADATVRAGFDPANSTVIKTVVPTTTKSHYARGSTNTSGTTTPYLKWTVEFQAYDSTRKYYVQQSNATSSTDQATTIIGSSLTGGDMSSSQLPISATNTSATDGTTLTVAGTTETGLTGGIGAGSTGGTNIRTFWLHLSNTGMIFAMTCENSSNLGFNNTYSNSTNYCGPFIFGQYTRHDYFNTDANAIFPLMYTNLNRAVGQGFGGATTDWAGTHNSMATYPTYTTAHPFKVVNLISAAQQSGSTWPVVTFPVVNWGVSNRFDERFGLSATSGIDTTQVSTVNYAPGIYTTANTRFPSADLKSVGFAMLPITWRHSYYNNTGGNMSERSGYYLYNGEYYPGDQFTYGGKTYVIFPTWTGYSARVGIAVPME